jgi:hypothetical protein
MRVWKDPQLSAGRACRVQNFRTRTILLILPIKFTYPSPIVAPKFDMLFFRFSYRRLAHPTHFSDDLDRDLILSRSSSNPEVLDPDLSRSSPIEVGLMHYMTTHRDLLLIVAYDIYKQNKPQHAIVFRKHK